jgi:PadR family transcriptional regulator PadR
MAKKPDLLPGTLDMLILKTLTRAPLHGYGVALSIKRLSDDVLTVEEGSLYPALQRLLLAGWVKAEWKMTETRRRARFYGSDLEVSLWTRTAGIRLAVSVCHRSPTVVWTPSNSK